MIEITLFRAKTRESSFAAADTVLEAVRSHIMR